MHDWFSACSEWSDGSYLPRLNCRFVHRVRTLSLTQAHIVLIITDSRGQKTKQPIVLPEPSWRKEKPMLNQLILARSILRLSQIDVAGVAERRCAEHRLFGRLTRACRQAPATLRRRAQLSLSSPLLHGFSRNSR